ncbi:hypothetical protein [Saccharopolyspora taberi]|uniref:DUF3040 domain-containing protein n=1 Tax=Saccharopolyspora taberi TaxID=60895 RepID=A0ABN3V8E6_9PSEU
MADRAAKPVTAGLSQVAQMDRRERARIVRQLCQQYPAFRSLLTQVTVARGIAFGSGLALAVAVMFLVQGVSVWWVATLVLGGLVGFGYVAVVLTDSRFDLLLAIIGAHRTDELHGRLVTEQIYGEDAPENPVFPTPAPVGVRRFLRRQSAS